MNELKKRSKLLILDMINRDNNTAFTEADLIFGTPQINSNPGAERNTDVEVSGAPTTTFSGPVTIHYNRLNLSTLKGGALNAVIPHDFTIDNVQDILTYLNLEYELELDSDDIVLTALDNPTSYPTVIEIEAKPESFGYFGGFTVAIGEPTPALPENVDDYPQISGLLYVGETLSVSTGFWTGTPTITYTFQWLKNGSPIADATDQTFLLPPDCEDSYVACFVYGTNGVGTGESIASGQYINPPLSAPVNVTQPFLVSEVPDVFAVGNMMYAIPGDWTGVPYPSFSNQWLKDGIAIEGELGNSYMPTEVGDYSCVVTATNSQGTSDVESVVETISATLDIQAIASTFLSNLLTWHPFEGDMEDAWGCWPLTYQNEAPTFDDAVNYGSTGTGQAVISGSRISQECFPNLQTATTFGLGVMVSAAAYNDGDFIAHIGGSNLHALSINETVGGYQARMKVGATEFGADFNAPVDEWNLVIAEHNAVGSLTIYVNNLASNDTIATPEDTGPISNIGIGGPSSLVLNNARMMSQFSYLGEMNDDTITYLRNDGAGRDLADIITDAEYVQPIVKMQEALGIGDSLAFSYSGRRVARRVASDTAPGYLASTNVYRCKGKYWLAVDMTVFVENGVFSAFYIASPDFATHYGGVKIGIAGGAANDRAGSVTAAMSPGFSGATGDIVKFLIDYDLGTITIQKNEFGTLDHYFDFTPGTVLGPGLIMQNMASFHYLMNTGEMPFTNPVGYLPYGDVALVPTTPDPDPHFSSVSALLPMQSLTTTSTFTDVTGKVWTSHGAATINPDVVAVGVGMGLFNGTDSYLSTPTHADFGFEDGDYTVEGYLIQNSVDVNSRCLFDNREVGVEGIGIYAGVNASGRRLYLADSGFILAGHGTAEFTPDVLNYWKVCRTAGVVKGYINDVEVWSVADSRTLASSAPVTVGANYVGAQVFEGRMSYVRITKGVDRVVSGDTQRIPFPLY